MYANLVQELLIEDTKTYKEMMRMNYNCFKQILKYIEPYITASESFHGTKVIKAAERSVLTVRFHATGETFRSLSFQRKRWFKMLASIANRTNIQCWSTFIKKLMNVGQHFCDIFGNFFHAHMLLYYSKLHQHVLANICC